MSFDLAARLAARRAEHLYRQRPLLDSPQGPQVVVDGQPYEAGIDPFNELVDRVSDDNRAQITLK